MITVLYPYKHSESKWNELKYSLRSVSKFLREEYNVIIIGDLPDYINPQKVIYIKHLSHFKGNESVLKDVNEKYTIALNHKDCNTDILRMYDDMYFLRPVKKEEIIPCATHNHNHRKSETGSYVWKEQLERTINECRKYSLPSYCYETHTPRMFSRERLKYILQYHDVINNPMLTATLYYNTFTKENPELIEKFDHRKVAFYGREDNISFIASDKYKTEAILKNAIEYLFPEKSEFEN
jgi:hypothetical protein